MSTSVTTGKVRFSFLNVFEAKQIGGKGDPKFSVSLIISKKDKVTLAKINAAIEEAKELGKSKKWGGKIPKKLTLPLRDGDEEREDDDNYANSFFVNANNKNRPGIVDVNLNAIVDQTEIYSGCYGRASITFFAYDTAGNIGVGCALNHVQMLEEGEALGGARVSAESAFAEDDSIF